MSSFATGAKSNASRAAGKAAGAVAGATSGMSSFAGDALASLSLKVADTATTTKEALSVSVGGTFAAAAAGISGLVPVIGPVVGAIFTSLGAVYGMAITAQHNKKQCKLAAERCKCSRSSFEPVRTSTPT